MLYYQDADLTIRDMEPGDPAVFTAEELAQGWTASEEKLQNRLLAREQGRAVCLTAVYRGAPAGYVHVYPDAQTGAFGGQGLPEIVDFAVLEKYRRRGIGGKLMDAAEAVAARYANRVCLGVGLHSGYGSAQRMYIRRGYLFDGSGVWYQDQVCPPYSPCRNDDELTLYLSKPLPPVAQEESL